MKTDYHCHILPGIDDGAKDITYTNDLRDALIERLRAAGIDVNTDWEEGERVLVKENERVRTEAEKAQQEVIHSPEFKAWFGDWELASKEILVIKKNGTHDFNLSQRTSDLKKDVVSYAKLHGIIGTMSDDETNHKGVVEITKSSIEKMVDDAVKAGDYKDDVFTALGSIRKLIKESVIGEIHEDHIKGADGVRRPENGSDPNIRIYRLYGAIDINGELYRAKTTIKETLSRDLRRAYTYELTSIELLNEKKIELLSGQTHSENISMSQPDNSISVAKLQNNLETLANFLEKVSNQRKNFIQEVANALGAESDGSKSEYKSFGTKNGLIVQADDYVDIIEYYDIKKI